MSIFSSLLDIVMDLVLVGGFGLGVAGAAAATVFAQGLSAVISICLLLRTLKSYDNQEGEKALFDVQMFGNMVKVAIPSMVQQSIVSIGMLLVQSVVNGFGSQALAGFSAGMRIESICVVPMAGIGNAISSFAAQNIGARQEKRVVEG